MSSHFIRKRFIHIAFSKRNAAFVDDTNEMTKHNAKKKQTMQKWTNNCLFWMVALPQCMKLWALVIPIWSTSVLYQWDFVLGAVKYIYIEGSWAFGLWACDAGWGWTSFSGFLQSLAHAAGCSNSSDTHAQERRFSAAWSLTGSDYTWGNRQHILKPFQEILKIT